MLTLHRFAGSIQRYSDELSNPEQTFGISGATTTARLRPNVTSLPRVVVPGCFGIRLPYMGHSTARHTFSARFCAFENQPKRAVSRRISVARLITGAPPQRRLREDGPKTKSA
jgi:hypothetical protein